MILFTKYIQELQSHLAEVTISDSEGKNVDIKKGFLQVVNHLGNLKRSGKKVMIIGNGGSAAIASHLQNDFCKAAQIRAMVFTETPLLTALSNDISYIAAYREQVTLWAEPGDILISISSSGRSQNILDALSSARNKGCAPIITLSGFRPDNPLRKMGDFNLYVPSMEYGYVELVHSILTHYISDQVSKIASIR
jgi:D-sedoheptulose 7-phosphate isomerase